jgi:hypothetical protein
MVKKCVYCSKELHDESVIDVCTPCGHGVWGEQMFSAIRQNMENAREKGDLHQVGIGSDMEIKDSDPNLGS